MAQTNNNVNITVNWKDNISPVMKSIGVSMKNFAGSIATFGAVAFWILSVWLKWAVESASKLQESTQMFWTVFKNTLPLANKYAQDLAKWFATSKEESLSLLAWMWSTLKAFWLWENAALWLSNKFQTLAWDISSFRNVAGWTAEVSQKFNAALSGEYDSLQTLGIAISDAVVQEELKKMWKDKSTGSTLFAAKAEAVYAIAVRSSKDAVGDFARNSGSYSSQMKRLKADITDASASIWEAFLPIATQFIGILKPVAESIWNWSKENKELATTIWLVWLTIAWLAIVLLPIASLFSSATVIVWALTTAVAVLTPALATLNAVLLANPIILIVAAIVWLIALVVSFRDELRDMLSAFIWWVDWFNNIFSTLIAPLRVWLKLLDFVISKLDYVFWSNKALKFDYTETLKIGWNNFNWVAPNDLKWFWQSYSKIWSSANQPVPVININNPQIRSEQDISKMGDQITQVFVRQSRLSNSWLSY